MIFVDSDVFLIDLRYRRDPKFNDNQVFLQSVKDSGKGMTTVFNVLEVCGILSFNLNSQQLRELFYYFPVRYNLKVLPISNESERLPVFTVGQIIQVIVRKVAFGDALIIALIEQIEGISTIVSWNARHFVGKLSLPAVTPSEMLKKGF